MMNSIVDFDIAQRNKPRRAKYWRGAVGKESKFVSVGDDQAGDRQWFAGLIQGNHCVATIGQL